MHSSYSRPLRSSIMALAAITGFAFMSASAVHAATSSAPVIAIIDDAINSKYIPNVIHEVCTTQNASCPNGQGFMEGPGSANIPTIGWTLEADRHGTEVAESAIQAKPNVKIVFIRIGLWYGTSMMQSGLDLDNALSWVAKNYKTYGIQAV
jgi:hypothetical protein